jgi:hypothetical protein
VAVVLGLLALAAVLRAPELDTRSMLYGVVNR